MDELLSPAGLTAQSPTFSRRDVVQALCERLAGHDVDAAGVQALAEHLTDPACSPFIPLGVHGSETLSPDDRVGGHTGRLVEASYTTSELLATERQVFTAALRRRTDRAGIAGPDAVTVALARAPGLADEQKEMVRRLCRSSALFFRAR